MITAEEFRKSIFEAPDLCLLASFAREVPSVRTENFCESLDGPDAGMLFALAEALRSDDSPMDGTLEPPPSNTAVMTAPAPTGIGLQRYGGRQSAPGAPSASSVTFAPSVPPSNKAQGIFGSSSIFGATPAGSDSDPFARLSLQSPSKNAVSTSGSSNSGKPTSGDQPFVFGDFGSDYPSQLPTSSNVLHRRQSRANSQDTSGSASELGAFGDFAYFIPKSTMEPQNKMESSFNRSMMRRTSVVTHKVLDELEEVSEDHDDNDRAESFSFGDFSLGNDDDFDSSPAARGFRPEKNDTDFAFMFGDFMIEMPETSLKTQKKKSDKSLVPQPPTSSSTSSGRGQQAVRLIRRPLVVHGSLVRHVDVRYLAGHQARVRGAVMASTGENCVISSGGDHYATMRPLGGTQPLSMYFGHQDMILHISISTDLSLVATSGSDNLLNVFEVSTSKKVGDCTHSVAVLCSTFSKNGKYVVSGSQDGICRLWPSKKKNQTTSMSNYFGHKSLITAIAFQPNGELVASASGDGQIHVWSASTAKTVTSLSKVHTNAVMSVHFAADGTQILSCDANRVILFEAKSGVLLTTLEASQQKAQGTTSGSYFFTGVAFAPQKEFPNYFFVSASDRSLTMFEFITTPGGKTPTVAASSASPLTKKGEKSAGPSDSVVISPEIWSTMMSRRVTWICTGYATTMVTGDAVGNIALVSLLKRKGEVNPPVRIVKGKSAPPKS